MSENPPRKLILLATDEHKQGVALHFVVDAVAPNPVGRRAKVRDVPEVTASFLEVEDPNPSTT